MLGICKSLLQKTTRSSTLISKTPNYAFRNYVTQAQRENLKKSEKNIDINIETHGLSASVPLDQMMLLRDDPLLSQLVNTIMREGKKTRAQKQVSQMLLEIKKATNSNPYKVLSDAIEMTSPLMATFSGKKGSKVIQIPKPLNLRQRRRKAILWILTESKKRGARSFHSKLSAEILAVINGTSGALQKKLALHKMVLANRAQVKANA
ncbi:hypothetical protein BB559_005918 [Furculomyces boomerangus]|uniref:Small ribosomal subunit protein uS7 domain-containing protein n=2 Tax=Harpellales TaxID=61421 RepID=A0A2T9Y1Z4_9FUNG|nr:hypothetical protein BB559_006559 [Furculomyces boomerangus]PVU87705.1 hypothetical protein BB559_005918 [Furculomyces boomerangus]PWA01692.1 hypothetical protein BB558_002197 [Smittium angustum]